MDSILFLNNRFLYRGYALMLLCRGSCDWWSRHPSRASAHAFNAVEQDLHNVFAVMGKCTWILGDPLVIVGCPQQVRSPGRVCIIACGFIAADLPVSVGIFEEVRVVGAAVADCVEAMIGRVCLHSRQQFFLHGLNLAGDAFRGVTVTVVISGVAIRVPVCARVCAAMAGCALIGVDRQLVNVMAFHTSVEGCNVGELAIVLLAGILVGSLRRRAEERGPSREVMRIDEAQGI